MNTVLEEDGLRRYTSSILIGLVRCRSSILIQTGRGFPIKGSDFDWHSAKGGEGRSKSME
jgi:hypothetical protein